MFQTKKKKIQSYLNAISHDAQSTFDLLLGDYLSGLMKNDLKQLGIAKTEIHIDWFDDIKCIGIQGKYCRYYMDLQIYPNEFSLSFDSSEPDESVIYPLESRELLYNTLSDAMQRLKD